jgi:hypothetical protein
MGAGMVRKVAVGIWPGIGPVRPRPSAPQPNEVDSRRIERALAGRSRYRYVHPEVHWERDGYRISSPCCSRNIDAQGGVIEIARLEFTAKPGRWHLYSRDHAAGCWVLQASGRLHELIDRLKHDPERIFWQ